ncbi:MAG: TetR/AcrR family transcriptional regulator [Lactimicrobium sp.]|jgi:AcrR family transcriptional regulator|uniref:TetR/AcrR family transcriptional regulator n=1 Tax=Lactimicrobium sp. TaxID=2563780 RepID=UPI002F360B37
MRRQGLNEEVIQQYIAEALLLLMQKKPYEKITIGEITQKAGVNRSSYYRHFDTKEDIIRYVLMHIMQEYLAAYQSGKDKSFEAYTLQIFTTFYTHRKELLLIHRNHLSYLLLDVLNTCFKFDAVKDEIGSARQFEISYHIGGIYNNMLLWMNHQMKETPEQIADIALSFKPEGSFTLLNVQ